MDSIVHGVLQIRILEWVAFPYGLHSPWNSPEQNTGVGSLSLLQGIFPTQGLNPGLPHCGWILYQLSHKGSPRILEWLIPSPADLPDPGIEPGSPALQADSLRAEQPRRPYALLTDCFSEDPCALLLQVHLPFFCPFSYSTP